MISDVVDMHTLYVNNEDAACIRNIPSSLRRRMLLLIRSLADLPLTLENEMLLELIL